MKVFHPQNALHEKIRDLVLDAYINDLQGNQGGPAGGDAAGDEISQCFFYLQQYRRCEPSGEEYFATLDMRQPDGLRIDEASRPDITAANQASPLVVTGGALKKDFSAVGKFDTGNQGDEQAMYFTYGDLQWNSANNDFKAPAYCDKPGAWDNPDWNCNGIGKRQFYAVDGSDRARAVSLSHYFEKKIVFSNCSVTSNAHWRVIFSVKVKSGSRP